MLIEHIKFSDTMSFFRERVEKKFDLKPVTSSDQPCVMWGISTKQDYKFLKTHKAPVILVFRGGDSTFIKKFDKKLLKKPVRIYAPSRFVSQTLSGYKIKHKILPLTGCPMDIDTEPRGECIYHYDSRKKTSTYGRQYIPEIERRTGLKVIKTNKFTYQRGELLDVYRQCFIGLRLTTHDGLPNTVLEMGMMGRRCIYNGDIPYSIPWRGIDDICKNVMVEYESRHESNEFISESIKNHLNVGSRWLNL